MDATLRTCVRLDVSLWSGRSKLTREDLKDANLPPEEVASLGSKHLFNPVLLRPFGALKMKARRACLAYGAQFLGGFLMPKDRLDELDQMLRGIKTEFDSAVNDLYLGYDSACHDWLNTFPEWADIIRSRMPSADEVRRKYGFDWQFYQMMPIDGYEALAGSVHLANADTGLKNDIVAEIAQSLSEVWSSFDTEKEHYNPKSYDRLDGAITKCHGLSFVHPEVGKLGDFLQSLKDFGEREHNIPAFRTIMKAATTYESLCNIIDMANNKASMTDISWAMNAPSMPAAQQSTEQTQVQNLLLQPIVSESETLKLSGNMIEVPVEQPATQMFGSLPNNGLW